MINIKRAECDCHAGYSHQGAMLTFGITYGPFIFYSVNNLMQ